MENPPSQSKWNFNNKIVCIHFCVRSRSRRISRCFDGTPLYFICRSWVTLSCNGVFVGDAGRRWYLRGSLLGSAMIGAMVPGFQWIREAPVIVDILSPIFSEVLVFIVAIIIVKFRPQGLIKRGRI